MSHHHKIEQSRKAVATAGAVQLKDEFSDEDASVASYENGEAVKAGEPQLDEAMLDEVLNDEQVTKRSQVSGFTYDYTIL